MDAVTIELMRLGFTVAAFLMAAAANIYVWYATRSKARRDDVDAELKAISDRMNGVERDLHHSPSQQQIQALHNRIGDVHAELKELSGNLKGINRLADIMNQHLMNQGADR